MPWITIPACLMVAVLACNVCCEPAINACFRLRQPTVLSSQATCQNLQLVNIYKACVQWSRMTRGGRAPGAIQRLPEGPMAPWGMWLCWGDSWIQRNWVVLATTDPTHSIGTELTSSPCASTAAVFMQWHTGWKALLEHHSFEYLPTAEELLLGNTCRLKGAPPAFKNKTKMNKQAQSICSPATSNSF